MGPGMDFEQKSNGLTPPMFEPDQDRYAYRKKLAGWVDLIATAAEKGSEKLYKTVFPTLGRQLYEQGLHQAQKSILDETHLEGNVDYKQEDQFKAFQEIVEPIAVELPMTSVTRLIDSFDRVTSCKLNSREGLNRFVSKLRGLAAEHLMRAGAHNSWRTKDKGEL